MESVFLEIIALKREVNKIYFESRRKDRIIKKLQCRNNKLSNRISSMKKENKKLSAQLKKFKFSVSQNTNTIQQNRNSDTHEYEVEKIISHKFTRNKRSFLIRWKNYDSSHDLWIEENDLSCSKLLKKYMKSITN